MEEARRRLELAWALIVLIVIVLLAILNSDPVGNGLVQLFGKDAKVWAIDLILIALIFYAFLRKKK